MGGQYLVTTIYQRSMEGSSGPKHRSDESDQCLVPNRNKNGKRKVDSCASSSLSIGQLVLLTGSPYFTFIVQKTQITHPFHVKEYPELDDEQLYRHARLFTSAVIAKIHTIDWTVELLRTDTLNAGMHANWYGLLGKKFKSIFGHVGGPALGGLVGLKEPNNYGTPYSLTEEFVSVYLLSMSVYRMHSLLPDSLKLRNINSNPGPNKSPNVLEEINMEDLTGIRGDSRLPAIGSERQLVSMGHQSSGALDLWNYPLFFRDLIPRNVDGSERADHVDMPSLEIYRDGEKCCEIQPISKKSSYDTNLKVGGFNRRTGSN